jgi:predicted DNA-binding transcriptional regulator AlpA
MSADLPHWPALLSDAATGAYLGGYDRRSVWRLLATDDTFPRPVQLGAGGTRWRRSDLDAYIAGMKPVDLSDRANKRKLNREKKSA